MSNTQKGSFLKGLFIKDDGNVPEQVSQGGATVQTTPTPTNFISASVQGVADNKFIEMLEKVIESNNLPGQDYFEFKKATENMKNLIPDEKTKFMTAFSVLSLQGCDKANLLVSVDHYVKVIQKEKENFDSELNITFNERVKTKQDQIEANKKELEELTKKMTELNSSILLLSQEAQKAEMEIRTTEANFKASADIIINELIKDKEKITNYLA